MMLIAILAIWLVLLVFVVVLCRIAASADGRNVALTERAPAGSTNEPPTNATGLVVWEKEPEVIPRDRRLTTHGVRRHRGRSAAGS